MLIGHTRCKRAESKSDETIREDLGNTVDPCYYQKTRNGAGKYNNNIMYGCGMFECPLDTVGLDATEDND